MPAALVRATTNLLETIANMAFINTPIRHTVTGITTIFTTEVITFAVDKKSRYWGWQVAFCTSFTPYQRKNRLSYLYHCCSNFNERYLSALPRGHEWLMTIAGTRSRFLSTSADW